jgi:hypothetical protein
MGEMKRPESTELKNTDIASEIWSLGLTKYDNDVNTEK